MTTLADKAILSGADNRPPMLEKDMNDSWKSRMELYMLNRQHGRMMLESVENGPLIWPTVEENGVTRLKKYFELSTTEAIQADCDNPNADARNVIDKTREGVQAVNTKFLNTLPPEWSKFVTDVKLVRDLHTTNVDQLHAYLGKHEYHANEVRIMHERTSDPLALVANHQINKSPYQPHQQLVVLVFQKGDDPIDEINHMMSFLTAVVTSRYPPTNNQLRTSSNPRQQATINNERGEGHMSKQCTKPKRKGDKAWFKEKVLLVQAQANGQVLHEEELEFLVDPGIADSKHTIYRSNGELVSLWIRLSCRVVNCTKINHDNKNVNETLTTELERYKNQVRILKEQNNVDKALSSCAQSLEIENLKHTLFEHLKEKESLEQRVTLLKNDFQKEESRNIDRELALEKQVKELNNIVFKRNQFAQTVHMLTKPQFFYDHFTRQALGFQNPCYLKRPQQLEPKLYDGSVIQKTDAIVIRDFEETLLLEDKSRFKMLKK
nr:hypothetical protein [Tanacetum cinerariifolium]